CWRGDAHLPPRSYAPPFGVRGFICQLPTQWTRGENNDSGINLTVLAQLLMQQNNQSYAAAPNPATQRRDSQS
ncbi:hypothetical protein, partial [Pseudomonas sp.]|uniref:hypothetical protein n=1 Tax=Pseudomonas sp. TaxID=306 RepID=UPI00272B8C18